MITKKQLNYSITKKYGSVKRFKESYNKYINVLIINQRSGKIEFCVFYDVEDLDRNVADKTFGNRVVLLTNHEFQAIVSKNIDKPLTKIVDELYNYVKSNWG